MHSPSEDERGQIPCRFCTSPAAAVYFLDRGCFAAPEDREQALCINHIMRANPLGGMDLVRVLLPEAYAEFMLFWLRGRPKALADDLAATDIPSAPPTRHCSACSEPITACMGFVKAGDVSDGRVPVRDLCGKCVLMWRWTAEGGLVRQNTLVGAEESEGDGPGGAAGAVWRSSS